MAKSFRGNINIDVRNSKADWSPYEQPKAPAGSPNVIYIVWDDVGFSAMEAFGGLIATPTLNRLAQNGLRYTNWHTTALCSPSRSCLLTGRNHTTNGMACIAEATTGFPGSNGHIPFECATLAEVLVERGYNTYLTGKWHLCAEDEVNMAASKRNWPLGRGFERFYGFLGGETNQWYPDLVYDNHPVEQPRSPEEGYHLSSDLADKAIEFIRDANVITPQKPFFLYFSPGACHAPHHVSKAWADTYQGKFDMGYERYREMTLAKQKQMGIIPPDTLLPTMNPAGTPTTRTGPDDLPFPEFDYAKPWDTLSQDEKRLFTRMAEVYAGFLSFTDHEIGRLIAYLEQADLLENTLIFVVSDNGASGEGGPHGSVNENKFFNGVPDTLEENLKYLDKLGSPDTYNHYCTGWTMAFNTPFKMWKRWTYNGGICDPLFISWPAGIAARGEIRHQYHHAIDIVPTVLDCLGIQAPDLVKGYAQYPIEGSSMRYSFTDPHAPTTKETQYYTMLGSRGIWHRGWKAVTTHPPISGWGHFSQDTWELYHTDTDRSEVHNLAAQYPEKLQELIQLWFVEAGRYQGLPLDDRTAVEIAATSRPQMSPPRDRYIYYPYCAEVPEASAVNMRNRSFTIKAEVENLTVTTQGVILAQGSRFGGLTLYVKDRNLHFVYNWLGDLPQKISSDRPLPTGDVTLSAIFTKEGEHPRGVAYGTLTLYSNNQKVGQGTIKTQPGKFSLAGEGLNVGRDSGEAVTSDYPGTRPWTFTGNLKRVVIDVSGDPHLDPDREAQAMMARE